MATLAIARLESLKTFFKSLVTIKPKEAPASVGIDFGSSSVKILALGRRKGSGARPVIATEQLSASEKPDETAAKLREAIEGLHLPTKTVALSVSGPSVIMRVVEMPVMKPAELKRALPFETQRYLPFPIQDVVLDGETLGSIDGKKAWVLVVACKKDLIEQRLNLAKRAGLEVGVIDVDALALANAFLETAAAQRKSATSAAINVGALMSSVVVFKDQTPYLVRDIPWGADRLCKDVAQQLGLEPALAKKQLAAPEVGEDFKEAVRAACEARVVELQLSFTWQSCATCT
jgi:type IV pilus assembly protein PilM